MKATCELNSNLRHLYGNFFTYLGENQVYTFSSSNLFFSFFFFFLFQLCGLHFLHCTVQFWFICNTTWFCVVSLPASVFFVECYAIMLNCVSFNLTLSGNHPGCESSVYTGSKTEQPQGVCEWYSMGATLIMPYLHSRWVANEMNSSMNTNMFQKYIDLYVN